MKLPVEDVTALIPQKYPFVLVGKLLHFDEQMIRSSFLIPDQHVMVCNGVLTEGGLLENIAQTAAAGAGYQAVINQNKVKEGYIAAIKDLEIFDLPATGSELITEVTLEAQWANMNVITGKVWNNNDLVAQCEMKILTSK